MEEEGVTGTEKQSILQLHVPSKKNNAETESIFVKATWFPSHFNLSITDGLDAWYCHASEDEVKQRAAQWDQPVSEYLQLSQRHLAHHQPSSVYSFDDAADGHKRLSCTFEKQGVTMLWRWKCLHSPDPKNTNVQILAFLTHSYTSQSENVGRNDDLFEKMKEEAEKCLIQSERIAKEREEFESEIYVKFLGVLNSKKAKLRELRDKLSKQKNAGKSPQEEDSEKTESFDEDSDDDQSDEDPPKDVLANKPSRPKRVRHT